MPSDKKKAKQAKALFSFTKFRDCSSDPKPAQISPSPVRTIPQCELRRLIPELALALQVDAVLLYLINPATDQPFFYTGYGLNPKHSIFREIQSWKGLTWRVIHKHDIVSIPDIWIDPATLARKQLFQVEGFISYHGVPLTKNGRLLGVLETLDRENRMRDAYWFFQFRDFAKTISSEINT